MLSVSTRQAEWFAENVQEASLAMVKAVDVLRYAMIIHVSGAIYDKNYFVPL